MYLGHTIVVCGFAVNAYGNAVVAATVISARANEHGKIIAACRRGQANGTGGFGEQTGSLSRVGSLALDGSKRTHRLTGVV